MVPLTMPMHQAKNTTDTVYRILSPVLTPPCDLVDQSGPSLKPPDERLLLTDELWASAHGYRRL